MTEQLLVAIAAESIREDLVDVLISLESVSGFSLATIDGYSRVHSEYDLKEQVAGYRQLCRLEVLHRPDQQATLLQALQAVCEASPVRYWITPVTEGGHLGGASPI